MVFEDTPISSAFGYSEMRKYAKEQFQPNTLVELALEFIEMNADEDEFLQFLQVADGTMEEAD